MKTIKVIDLLNKIANGEEIPKKIKYINQVWIYKRNGITVDYQDKENRNLMDWVAIDKNDLNEKVEIIEEDKEIEPLDVYTNAYIRNEMSSFYEHNFETTVKHNFEAINKKINELIIAVNELKKGK